MPIEWFNRDPLTADPPALEVFLLGLVDFAQIDTLQYQLVRRVKLSHQPTAYLIVVEHPPIITIGRHGSRAHIRADDAELQSLGVEVRWVARGGGVAVHCPGQLVAYPVLSVRTHGYNVRQYVEKLRNVLVATLADFDIRARTFAGQEGVWANGRRVADVGVGISGWVAHYGMALNVEAHTGWLQLVDPPGPLVGGAMSMSHMRRRRLDMAAVREALVRQFETQFHFRRQHLYTYHPLVTRRTRRPVFVGSLD